MHTLWDKDFCNYGLPGLLNNDSLVFRHLNMLPLETLPHESRIGDYSYMHALIMEHRMKNFILYKYNYALQTMISYKYSYCLCGAD